MDGMGWGWLGWDEVVSLWVMQSKRLCFEGDSGTMNTARPDLARHHITRRSNLPNHLDSVKTENVG